MKFKRLKSIIKKVIIIVLINVSVLVCLIAAFVACLEFYLRFFSDYPEKVSVTPGYVRTHPARRYELVPNFQGLTYGVPLDINAAGYRGKLVDVEDSNKNNFRILVFGDSNTFGLGVRADETYSAFLEKKLNETSNGVEFQVLNFGIPSYNTTREVEYFKDTGLLYNPNAVILAFNLEDTEDANYMKTSSINRYFIVRYIKDRLRHLYSYEVLASHFYNFIYRLEGYYPKKDNEIGDVSEKLTKEAENYVRDDWTGWIKAKGALQELASICQERNIELFVMIFSLNPLQSVIGDDSYFIPILDKIEKQFYNIGIRHFVDPLKRMKQVDNPKDLCVKPYDCHFSALGHQILAEELFEALVKEY